MGRLGECQQMCRTQGGGKGKGISVFIMRHWQGMTWQCRSVWGRGPRQVRVCAAGAGPQRSALGAPARRGAGYRDAGWGKRGVRWACGTLPGACGLG